MAIPAALWPLLFVLLEGGRTAYDQFVVPRAAERELQFKERQASESRKANNLQAALLLTEDERSKAESRAERSDLARLLTAHGNSQAVEASALQALQDAMMAPGAVRGGFEGAIQGGMDERNLAQMRAQQMMSQGGGSEALRMLGLM